MKKKTISHSADCKKLIGSLKKFSDTDKELFLSVCQCGSNGSEHKKQQPPMFIPFDPSTIQTDRSFDAKSDLTPQTYRQWKAMMQLGFKFRKLRTRNCIYVQPIDQFPEFLSNFKIQINSVNCNFFELLTKFAKYYFSGIDVKILPSVDTVKEQWQLTSRLHKTTNQSQLLVSDMYTNLKNYLPKDGHCILGITWTDLYPCEDLNFLLGEASSNMRCGVFCFGRFEPKTYNTALSKEDNDIQAIDGSLLWRMIKVICHETCHTFGLSHCVFYNCAMNASHTLEQAFNQPIFLCPVCLKKLHRVCKFSVLERYEQLQRILRQLNEIFPLQQFEDSINWTERVMEHMQQMPRS